MTELFVIIAIAFALVTVATTRTWSQPQHWRRLQPNKRDQSHKEAGTPL